MQYKNEEKDDLEKELVDGFLKGLGEKLKNTDDQTKALYYSIRSLKKEGKYAEAAVIVNTAMELITNELGRARRERDEKFLADLEKDA